ncbi:hypothetical protein F66182_1164 [Fusarium sp. NRRL 66182]|nr:hypothetical protein F66182_1164 [Fusarium sp. NRRL 66182]
MDEDSLPIDREYVEENGLDPAQKELSAILLTMDTDPTLLGITILGKDGVLRAFTADREVVYAVPLTPPLIKALLDRLPYDKEAERELRGVDGTTAPKEQWYKPLLADIPEPLPEEHRQISPQVLERLREKWFERKRSIEEGTYVRQCPVCLMSDNDLGSGAGRRQPEKASVSGR